MRANNSYIKEYKRYFVYIYILKKKINKIWNLIGMEAALSHNGTRMSFLVRLGEES